MQKVYLTRRNLITLLNKLDRNKLSTRNINSHCTIIKQDTVHPKYPCTEVIEVTAVEYEAYYTDREPGNVFSVDEPK